MLPTIEDQDNKILEIYSNQLSTSQLDNSELYCIRKFAKWYAEQVIKHCAEVAEIDGEYYCVDKQSITNIINEL